MDTTEHYTNDTSWYILAYALKIKMTAKLMNDKVCVYAQICIKCQYYLEMVKVLCPATTIMYYKRNDYLDLPI